MFKIICLMQSNHFSGNLVSPIHYSQTIILLRVAKFNYNLITKGL